MVAQSVMKSLQIICIRQYAECMVIQHIAERTVALQRTQSRIKCRQKIKQIRQKEGITFLFVTHAPNFAKEFCKRGIVLEHGKIKFDGPIEEAIKLYEKMV